MSLKEKTISLIVGNGLHAISHVFIIIICSRFLAASDYGSYRQFLTVYELAVPVVGMGLSQSIFYFFARSERKFDVLVRSIFLLLVASVFFELFFYIFKQDILESIFSKNVLKGVFPLVGFFVFTSLVIPVFGALLIDSNLARTFSLCNSVYVTLLGVCVSLVAYFSRDASLVVIVRVVFSGAFAVFLLLLSYKIVGVRESFKFTHSVLSVNALFGVLKYSIPLGAASAVGMLVQQIDKLIVSAYSSPTGFAVYVNGAMEIPLISILTGALATAAISELATKVKNGNLNESLIIFRRIASLSSLVLFPVFVFFMVSADVFMVALFGDAYAESATPFRIYLCLIPARVVFFGPVLVAFGKARIVLFRSFVELILVVILGLAFAKLFGYVGVAAAIVIITYLWSVLFNLVKLRNCFQVNMNQLLPYKDLAKKLMVSVFASPAAYLTLYCEFFNSIVALVASFLLYGFCVFLMLYMLRDSDTRKLSRYMKGRLA